MFKVLHFADCHARDKDIEEIETCLNEIVRVAQDEEPDLIAMAGDTFDSRLIKLDSQAARLIFDIYSKLADIAPMVAITGTPSHDGLAPQVLEHVQAENPIHVADYPEQIAFIQGLFVPVSNLQEGKPDAIISCIPTPTKQYWQEFGGKYESAKETDAEVAQAMSAMLANFGAVAEGFDCPHVLVGHFQVGGAFLSETQQLIGQDIELSRDQIGLSNPTIALLGHIHLHQQIGDNIFYSGSIYRKDWGELDEKGFYIHDIIEKVEVLEGKGFYVSSRFLTTPTRKLVKVKFDFTDSPIEELDACLYSLSREEIEGAHIRVELQAYQDDVTKIDRSKIEEFYKSAGAIEVEVKINSVPRETVRCTTLLELERLRDKIQEMALLRQEEVPESILAKADMLETMTPDEIYEGLVGKKPEMRKTAQVLDLNEGVWPFKEVAVG